MPKSDFYYGLPLAEAISKLAEHHFEAKNRHISEDEYRLLVRAAEALKADHEFRDAVVSLHDAAMQLVQGPAANVIEQHLDLPSTGNRPTPLPSMAVSR
jgi:hypothetical protein